MSEDKHRDLKEMLERGKIELHGVPIGEMYKHVGPPYYAPKTNYLMASMGKYLEGKSADFIVLDDPTGDIHRHTAATMFDKEPEDVTDDERRLGKVVNYAHMYESDAGRMLELLEDLAESPPPFDLDELKVAHRTLCSQPNIQSIPRPPKRKWWQFWKWFRKEPRLYMSWDLSTEQAKTVMVSYAKAEKRIAGWYSERVSGRYLSDRPNESNISKKQMDSYHALCSEVPADDQSADV